jgi:undecaprenyl-diphosphatase
LRRRNSDLDRRSGLAPPPKTMILILLLTASASIVGEYLLPATISATVPTGLSDNFPPQLSSLDTSLFLSTNLDMSNEILNILFLALTLLGGFSASVVLAELFFVGGHQRKAILAISSVLLASAITGVIKVIVARPRPFMVLPGIHVLALEADWSFPSGHASRVFSLLPLASGSDRRLRFSCYTLACLVAFSRIYLGVHYPLDTVGGAMLGLFLGGTVNNFEWLLVPRVEAAATRLRGIITRRSKLNTDQAD